MHIEWTDDDIRRLRAGVLEASLREVVDGRNGENSRREALEWVESNEIHPFSFVCCCREFGMNPDNLRAALDDMRWANREKFFARADRSSDSLAEKEPSHEALEWLTGLAA